MGSGTIDKFIYRPVDKQTGSSRASDPRKSSAVFLNERFQICSSTRSLLASCLRNAHTESSALCPATSPPPPENAGARASRGVDTPPLPLLPPSTALRPHNAASPPLLEHTTTHRQRAGAAFSGRRRRRGRRRRGSMLVRRQGRRTRRDDGLF